MWGVHIRSYAKINLTLAITGMEGQYHTIDSVAASVNLSDYIVLKRRKDDLINVYMHGYGSERIPPEKNNAVKAGEAFVEAFRTKGADIEIWKDIPIGAGLGGSSADASGVLRGMAKLYKIKDDLKPLADTLGSDTGYMLGGGYARMTGRGEIVQPFSADSKLHFLLFLPSGGVSSGACYKKYDELFPDEKNTSEQAIAALQAGDLAALGASLHNALYQPACILQEGVGRAYEAAQSFSPLGVVMTGSGSGVLALFESSEMCAWAKSRYRGECRVLQLSTIPSAREKLKLNLFRNPFALSESETEESEQ